MFRSKKWPKSVWPKSVKTTIGQSRSKIWAKSVWPKSVNTLLANVGLAKVSQHSKTLKLATIGQLELAKTGLAKVGQLRLAKVGQNFSGQSRFGQSRIWPKSVSAVCEDQDPQMCTFGLSGCRVKPRRLRRRPPRETKRAREGRRKKKREILGPPTLRGTQIGLAGLAKTGLAQSRSLPFACG